MAQYETSKHRDSIDDGHAEYSEGDRINNLKFSDSYVVHSIYYDKRKDCIMYSLMRLRERFNMFEIAECVLIRNIERGTMEVQKR